MDSVSHEAQPTGWRDTALWESLGRSQGPDAQPVCRAVESCMEKAVPVLESAGTAPTDFTLHDAGHAFRVAARMAEIIPSDVLPQLQPYDLAFLLLSAYLHDIGMNPQQRRVNLHHDYLITGKPGGLSGEHTQAFQRWLDDEGLDIVPPLCEGQPTPDELRRARLVIAHYSRRCHDDWSGEWIQGELAGIHLGAYEGWLDDLAALCRSHGEGYHSLASDRFNPRPVGSPSQVVHLRYLAVVLRVADILEFDPKRTPDVILRHRDIAIGSLIYWWKDQQISFTLDGARPVISARPPTAKIHRAIEQTADAVDAELQLASTLSAEKPFDHCPALPNEKLPHRWDLWPRVHRDIVPRSGTYEYIDGAFRPNTQKLLELFSGVELYRSKMVAVRELLQNAFDAVKEQIAYDRLQQPNPAAKKHEKQLGKLHKVELRLEKGNASGDYWLVCTDTGVGMTKRILTNHFLVSGRPRRHDVLDLERRCETAGFHLGRTGQFGVGVLSYFMLADRVVIRTRRSQSPADSEPNGWHFETEGVGSFGELKKDSLAQPGTEVRLRLRDALVGDPSKWFAGLRAYVEWYLMWIPARFVLKTNIPSGRSLKFGPGWVAGKKHLRELVLRGVRNLAKKRMKRLAGELPLDQLPHGKRQEVRQEQQHWQEIEREVAGRLRFDTVEGEIGGGAARFRIHLPFFDLPGGPSLGFVRPIKRGRRTELAKIGIGYLLVPEGSVRTAWKGITLSALLPYGRHGQRVIREVDWHSPLAGRLSLDRSTFTPSPQGQAALAELDARIAQVRDEHVRGAAPSPFHAISCRIAGSGVSSRQNQKWIAVRGDRSYWSTIKFPVISSLACVFGSLEKAFLQRREASVLQSLPGPEDSDHYEGMCWTQQGQAPDRIVMFPSYRFQVAALWTKLPQVGEASHPMGLTADLPNIWKSLCGVYFAAYYAAFTSEVIWNPANTLVRVVRQKDLEWLHSVIEDSLDPLPVRKQLLEKRGRAAAWILRVVRANNADLWHGVRDRDPSFLADLWQLAFGRPYDKKHSNPILFWVEDTSDSMLRVVTPKRWTVHKCPNQANLLEYLPTPGPKWCLKSEK